MDITQYIKESVDRQYPDGDATPEAYIGMARAYEYAVHEIYAQARKYNLYIHDIAPLICRILNEPHWVDFRNQPIHFDDGTISSVNSSDVILRQVELLILHQEAMTPREFYLAAEELHPYLDGNGRLFSLIFNVLQSTIMNPEHPPRYRKPEPLTMGVK